MYQYQCIDFTLHSNTEKTVEMTGIERGQEGMPNLYSVTTNQKDDEYIFRDKGEAYAETLRRIVDAVNASCKKYDYGVRFTLIQLNPDDTPQSGAPEENYEDE